MLVSLRDEVCRAPGCSVRAGDCELDHLVEFTNEHGATFYANLVFLCPMHHVEKTAGWYGRRIIEEEGESVVEFINTRDGSRYRTRPRRPMHPVAFKDLKRKHEEKYGQDELPPF